MGSERQGSPARRDPSRAGARRARGDCSQWAGAGDAFGRLELWVWAIVAGLLFRAPGTWLGFWTINRTGVQTYLIALTAMPFFAIALEALAAHLGWVASPDLSMAEWLAAAIILAAAVWLILVRLRVTP